MRSKGRGTDDALAVNLRRCADDLLVCDVAGGDVDESWFTRLAGDDRCPAASVSDVTRDQDEV